MTKDPTDDDIAVIAQVCHAALRAFRAARGEEPLPAWADAPDWQHRSTVEAVRFRLASPDAPASAQHDQWMAERLREGWRHGSVKDAARKTHPMLVPYNRLPESEKRKDALVVAIIRALTDRLA